MLNMNFAKRVVINTFSQDWQASPKPGVWRKPLAREEAERGHATSIVRYDAGASFHAHNHPLGEEILVIEGTFSDATGDYPNGSYLRNPEGFRHAPFSKAGTLILVKLHQFQTDDEKHVAIQTNTANWLLDDRQVEVLDLHHFGQEQVRLERWAAGTQAPRYAGSGGEELYVLEGELQDKSGSYPAGTWLRNPPTNSIRPQTVSQVIADTLLWIKTGHL